ncbi:hypothetical protein LU631_09825 [Erwinia tracheiphila]|uniref:Mor transcription activator family protein n=1 Tax=Erwinia tracheiphila TaxID=65700 RepID=UPI00033AF859|nr:Mor transcription activator family protein [Erwinia tracheiphila]EOS94051.1 hypothetical protein ETR_15816 [Erwinia tracheiphila PSU-1]UIA89456.1 hypothetical protein LU631_09825 [Erwinia tracheiphila]UIA97838.1 hypothetical protein LU633_08505 [Erwinia tracheiphila]
MIRNKNFESVSELLQAVVLELVELIGYRDTQSLIEHVGGVSFPVGKNVNTTGKRRVDVLASAVPVESAKKIAARFGGETLYIPRCSAALRELRNRRFIAEYHALRAAGESGALRC